MGTPRVAKNLGYLDRTWGEEVLGRDEVGGGRVVGRVGLEEGDEGAVPGDDDVLCAESRPLLDEGR